MQHYHKALTILGAVLMATILFTGCNAPAAPVQEDVSLVGEWQSLDDQAEPLSFALVLNQDGTGSLNGNPLTWIFLDGQLVMQSSSGSSRLDVTITPTTLSLQGTEGPPLHLHRKTVTDPS